MKTKIKLLSYEKWKRLNEIEEEYVECDKCKGIGEIDKVCDCCGTNLTKTCDECHGCGEIIDKNEYNLQLKKDKEIVTKIFGKSVEFYL